MQKPLKSLTFPGLDDVYTIPQVDETLTIPGAAADAEKVGIALDTIDSNMFGELERIEQYASGLRVRNLLDNSYFAKPINQRGQSAYSGNTYTIDRWSMWGQMYLEIKNGYIEFWNGDSGDRSITQKFEVGTFDRNKKYTLAWKEADGNIFIHTNTIFYNTDGNSEDINIPFAANQTRQIVWVALYEGEYTAETLPEYVYKGYATELMECQRYYQVFQRGYRPLGYGYSASASETTLRIDIPCAPFRTTPSVVFSGTIGNLRLKYSTEAPVQVTEIGTAQYHANGHAVSIYVKPSQIFSGVFVAYCVSSSEKIEFTADL